MKFQKFEHFFFIFGSILIVVFNAILVVFIGLVAFGIFKETSIIFFVKRLMSTTVAFEMRNNEGKTLLEWAIQRQQTAALCIH